MQIINIIYVPTVQSYSRCNTKLTKRLIDLKTKSLQHTLDQVTILQLCNWTAWTKRQPRVFLWLFSFGTQWSNTEEDRPCFRRRRSCWISCCQSRASSSGNHWERTAFPNFLKKIFNFNLLGIYLIEQILVFSQLTEYMKV